MGGFFTSHIDFIDIGSRIIGIKINNIKLKMLYDQISNTHAVQTYTHRLVFNLF